jgi:hypothetical protein
VQFLRKVAILSRAGFATRTRVGEETLIEDALLGPDRSRTGYTREFVSHRIDGWDRDIVGMAGEAIFLVATIRAEVMRKANWRILSVQWLSRESDEIHIECWKQTPTCDQSIWGRSNDPRPRRKGFRLSSPPKLWNLRLFFLIANGNARRSNGSRKATFDGGFAFPLCVSSVFAFGLGAISSYRSRSSAHRPSSK